MKRLVAVGMLLVAAHALQAADEPQISQAELVRRTQAMYDALPAGDKLPWTTYYADDALYFDEKGRDFDKVHLLADIEPMPKGYGGVIVVDHVKSRFAANVAILSYDAEETETVFGRVLHARYHTTDTWLYRHAQWQIAASETMRYYEDPAAGTVRAAVLQDYVGQYELTPGMVLTVTARGDQLFAQRGTAAPVALLPESPDMFFRAGVEGRRLFHRDGSGKVDMLIDRRNNEDLLWKKL